MKAKIFVLLTLGLVTALSACQASRDNTPTGTPGSPTENPSPTTPPEAPPSPSP